MKINVTLPFDHLDPPGEFDHAAAVVEIATLLEQLGFHGVTVTDHPCPTDRWLEGGGHHAQDPFVILSFVAAATRRLRLQTGILVLPYRNPFITARAVSTLDALSGGRVTLGVGAGYLKGEYRALGVDFEQRNTLTDEYLRACKAAWSGEPFSFQGTGYEAKGNRILPAPAQKPHPPLLVGGNSRLAIRRAVELADGWSPFFTAGALSATSRTAEIASYDDLEAAIGYLREHCAAIGRASPPKVVLGSLSSPGRKRDAAGMLEDIARLRGMGVDAAAVYFAGRTRAEWCDQARRFADDVLAKI